MSLNRNVLLITCLRHILYNESKENNSKQAAPFYNSRIGFYDSANKLNFFREKEKRGLYETHKSLSTST